MKVEEYNTAVLRYQLRIVCADYTSDDRKKEAEKDAARRAIAGLRITSCRPMPGTEFREDEKGWQPLEIPY